MKPLSRESRLARLFRAISDLPQEAFAQACGFHPVTVAKYEAGMRPSPEHLEAMARCVGLTVAEGDELLRLADAFRRARRRQGRGAVGLFDRLGKTLTARGERFHQQLLKLPPPATSPRAEDCFQAKEHMVLLRQMSAEQRLRAVKAYRGLQTWAHCEAAAAESVTLASRDLAAAESWARLAVEIAELVRGPEGWCKRLRGFAAAHPPNLLRVRGELQEAEQGLRSARLLWDAGADPYGLLDPARLLDFEASLLRAQRRFPEALDRLDDALPVSHCPGQVLVNRATILHVMGEYGPAVEALLRAEPLIDREAEPRLWYKHRANLATNFSLVDRHREAEALVEQVKPLAEKLGDKLDLLRLTWLSGRIAGGLGRHEEGLRLLDEAREGFEAEGLWYDVALALLETAVLLLDLGRTAEVKALAPDLARVFNAQGIHREALAALRLFRRAAEQEEATADYARRVLGFLLRARYDEGLQFRAN